MDIVIPYYFLDHWNAVYANMLLEKVTLIIIISEHLRSTLTKKVYRKSVIAVS